MNNGSDNGCERRKDRGKVQERLDRARRLVRREGAAGGGLEIGGMAGADAFPLSGESVAPSAQKLCNARRQKREQIHTGREGAAVTSGDDTMRLFGTVVENTMRSNKGEGVHVHSPPPSSSAAMITFSKNDPASVSSANTSAASHVSSSTLLTTPRTIHQVMHPTQDT